ncbi:thioredoxin domain-containing protein [Aureibaculum sp. 2210JD6-5]|uniref:thioredoxin domain-containing protein n=1 Tax=Aureibaculum sp. 2210JD6-5 TaxID=3103957 RepID=UPI002AAC9BA1|nr:thioredoxin domain-containing protein [Aureibaculum sp. 2210JD6-5]MDY7396241.1 thioredoxin domain-containing protein [Aureibaculum sp. 2210JD6-5]
MTRHKYTNNLINETSPYLLQHAHNPVNWYAWNDETLALAKKEKKLILISIGYAACHWCHVMEHESFEDSTVANIMNQNFINIKVDREERPDVDQIYINAVQLMTGSAGWPLNCIALPDGRPVWGATYLPKENWKSALQQIIKLYKENPEKIEEYATQLTAGVQESGLVTLNTSEKKYSVIELDTVVENWKKYMDTDLGGSAGAPKFPMPNNYQFLLRYAVQHNDKQMLDYVNTTLTNMAYGGLYDQVGGGFSRYSVDAKWHIPHFEKMLYDNGQLVSLYANAYLVTKNPLYKQIVYETTAFVERELMDKTGAFYSSLDADSKDEKGELEEGVFYVWKIEELKSILKNDFDLFAEYYNIKDAYKWENETYHLNRIATDDKIFENFQISKEDLSKKAATWKETLLKAREQKDRPRLDDKILTSWNALMLKGYVDAYSVFDDGHFLEKALKTANFINKVQHKEDGSLYRNYKDGKSSINAYLIDYATTIDAFINLYEVTLDEKWLHNAKKMTDYCFDHFYDDKSQMFYFTSDNDPQLITRKIETDDNVIPSSNSIMANNLFKLGHYFANPTYAKNADQMLHNVKDKAVQYGGGFSNWLLLYSNYLGKFYEVAIVGKDAKEKLKEFNQKYIPNKLIVGSTTDSKLPLLEYKYSENETTFYVCIDGTCQLPVNETEKAFEQIKVQIE